MKYKSVFGVIGGTLLLSFGTAVFILPFELIAGGLSGVALLIAEVVPAGVVGANDVIAVLSWSLFLVGRFTLGKSFSRKTLLSAVVYPVGLFLFRPLAGYGLWDLQSLWGYDSALLLAAVLGGVFVGTGCALTFGSGGSTGGIDIVALVIERRFLRIKYEAVLFLVDATVIILGFFVHKSLRHSLLGILCAAVTALTIGRLFALWGRGERI